MAYFLAALFGGFFLFNSLATPKKAARAIESSLRQLFPGAQVRADVQGKRGRDVLKGRFRSARIEMSGFSFDSGAGLAVQVVPSAKNLGRVGRFEVVLRDFGFQSFRIQSAEMSLDNLFVDWKALRKSSQLKLVASPDPSTPRTTGRVRLVLGQDALQSWVRASYPDLANATVALSGNSGIRVRGTRALMGGEIPFELAGRLNVRDGRVLEVAGATVTAGGVPLTGPLAAPFTKSLSSLFELDPQGAWPLSVSQTQIQVQNAPSGPALVLEAAIALKPAAQVMEPR